MTTRSLDTAQERRAARPGQARAPRRSVANRGAVSCVVSRVAAAPPIARRPLTLPHPFHPRTLETS